MIVSEFQFIFECKFQADIHFISSLGFFVLMVSMFIDRLNRILVSFLGLSYRNIITGKCLFRILIIGWVLATVLAVVKVLSTDLTTSVEGRSDELKSLIWNFTFHSIFLIFISCTTSFIVWKDIYVSRH